MKITTIASIAFETLRKTSKDLATVVKIVAVIVNALNQQGYVDITERGLEQDSLAQEDQEIANRIINNVIAEA